MPFPTDDSHDLIRPVESHPESRAELRRLVLTDELLALPEQVGALTREVTTLATPQQHFAELLGRLGKGPSIRHSREPVPERQSQELLPVGAKGGRIHDRERLGPPRRPWRQRPPQGPRERPPRHAGAARPAPARPARG